MATTLRNPPGAITPSSIALPTSNTASRVPLDVMAAVFCHADISLRDLGAARLVCRHWRSAIDGLTVRRLTLRSPGPGHCALHLLHRLPLLQTLSLGHQVTSNRAAFTWALGQLPTLVHLTRLSLEFGSAAAVRLSTSLQALTRLQSLSLSVGVAQLGQSRAPNVRTSADDEFEGHGSRTRSGADNTTTHIERPMASRAAAAAAAAAVVATAVVTGNAAGGSGGNGDAARAAQHVPPAGLLPLLSQLGALTSLELANIGISVPDVLAAVRKSPPARAAAGDLSGSGSIRGCLRRLVLIGSGVNLTGVGDPAAVAQLAMLETLHVDGCTGADALVPLLCHLQGVQHLTLAGMDYAWAAAAGYHHRRARVDSSNNLQIDANGHNRRNHLHNHLHNNYQAQELFAVNPNPGDGGGDGLYGDAAAAVMAATSSGRPLAFLLCLPRLATLSLAGSFLRTLPSRDIGCLAMLTALDLSGNGIDDLPQGLASLSRLARLDVSHNELVSMPGWLVQMQSLESLSCHHNCLERFPALLYELTQLSYLALGHNRISWWPVECVLPRHRRLAAATAAGITLPGTSVSSPSAPGSPSSVITGDTPPSSQPLSLVSLDLSHNRLFGLPGGLPLLASLRSLRLRESLPGLDGAATARAMSLLAGLTALRELDLSSNHLDQHAIVPLSELRGLRQLWLADNGLEELPLGLAHLSHLTLLSLRANRFTEVPVCLRWLSSLEALDLSCNRLSELPPWIGGGVNGHANNHNDQNTNDDRSKVNGRQRPSCDGRREDLRAGEGWWGGLPRGRGGGGDGRADDISVFPLQDLTGSDIQRPPPLHQHDHHHPSPSSQHNDEKQQDWQQLHQRQGQQNHHPQQQQQHSQDKEEKQQGHGHLGLVGLRHLDISQQYSVFVRESAVPDIPPILEVQPPHCLYGPLQGDLPEELLHLPFLRSLVLQRHLLMGLPCIGVNWAGLGVLRRLQARGVEIVHPRPLRVDALPGAAAAAFTTAAASGGLLFPPGHHSKTLLRIAAAAAAAAAARGRGGAGGSVSTTVARLAEEQALQGGSRTSSSLLLNFLGLSESPRVLVLMVVLLLATAALCHQLQLPASPHAVRWQVVLVAIVVITLYGICISRDLKQRRGRRRGQLDTAAVVPDVAASLGAPRGGAAQ